MERPYEKLIAWQEAFKLCLWIYSITKSFPSDEKQALVSQMRRSATSVPINMAEGNAKRSKKDHARYLEISLGSLEELHCECRIAVGLKYMTQEQSEKADEWIHRVSYLINKLRTSILS